LGVCEKPFLRRRLLGQVFRQNCVTKMHQCQNYILPKVEGEKILARIFFQKNLAAG
jgi:hypothetical protein